MRLASAKLVTYSGGTTWEDYALTSNTTTYSDSIRTAETAGYASLLAVTNGSVSLSYQLSNDNTNWYAPFDDSGNAISSITTTLTGDRWIVYTPQIAQYMRYKVFARGAATTTFTHMEYTDV